MAKKIFNTRDRPYHFIEFLYSETAAKEKYIVAQAPDGTIIKYTHSQHLDQNKNLIRRDNSELPSDIQKVCFGTSNIFILDIVESGFSAAKMFDAMAAHHGNTQPSLH